MNSGELADQGVTPREVPIPEDLLEFLEIVEQMVREVEAGRCAHPEGEGAILWDEVTWSTVGIFQPRMIGFPDRDLGGFSFQYMAYFARGSTDWDIEMTRQELAAIARGEVRHLLLMPASTRSAVTRRAVRTSAARTAASTRRLRRAPSPSRAWRGSAPIVASL